MPRMIPDDIVPTDVTEGAPDPNPPTGEVEKQPSETEEPKKDHHGHKHGHRKPS